MSCPVLKTFFYPMHIHFVASFFRAELCQKNLKRMHNDRINTVWLWRTSQHAKTNGISYECERIIRGVASGPAAGLIAPCARRRSLSLSLSLWRTLFTLTSNFFPLSQQSVEFALGGGKETSSGAKTKCLKTPGPSPWTYKKPPFQPLRYSVTVFERWLRKVKSKRLIAR